MKTTFDKFYQAHKRYFTVKKVGKTGEKYVIKSGYLMTMDKELIDTVERRIHPHPDDEPAYDHTMMTFSAKSSLTWDSAWFNSGQPHVDKYAFKLYSYKAVA